ncbi:hypothetical protein KBB06_00055 [Candidatus Gracilibacteria bacterium]|nr:hypothetical protein [Candidatus Gracilibacteria bacterium]
MGLAPGEGGGSPESNLLRLDTRIVSERLRLDRRTQEKYESRNRDAVQRHLVERKSRVGETIRRETIINFSLNLDSNSENFFRDLLKKSIKDEIRERNTTTEGSRNIEKEFYEASLNQIFSKDVFSALLDSCYEEFLNKNYKDIAVPKPSLEQLRQNKEFITYVRDESLKLMRQNYEASVSVSSENTLNQIFEIDEDNGKNLEKLAVRDEVAKNILSFTQKHEKALVEYNSLTADDFEKKYGGKEKFKKAFLALFSGKGVDVTKNIDAINLLFEDLLTLSEELYVNQIKLDQSVGKMVAFSGKSDAEWQEMMNQANKETENRIKESQTRQGSTQPGNLPPTQSSSGTGLGSSFDTYSSYSGYSVRGDGTLDVPVMDTFTQDFHPKVRIIRDINGGISSYRVFDEFNKKWVLCKPDDMVDLIRRLSLDYILNKGLLNDQLGSSGIRIPPNINAAITDKVMVEMADNLLRLRTQVMQAEDYLMMRNLFIVLINEDTAQGYNFMEERIQKMSAYLGDPSKSGALFAFLKKNKDKQDVIRATTVSKVIEGKM